MNETLQLCMRECVSTPHFGVAVGRHSTVCRILWASPYAQLPDKSQTAIVARVAFVVFAFGVAKRMRRHFG